jgi:pantoate--beta-alanine ligase
MKTVETVEELRTLLRPWRQEDRHIGFVPTMGGLHAGHESLIRRANSECAVTVTSIFVNPLQFSPSEDYDRYPRDHARDALLAEAAGTDILFMPTPEGLFPASPLTTVSVAKLSEELEGASRPGHFAGVATIVTKLFNIVQPTKAYFGEKDWQQLEILRQMVEDLSIPVEIVPCAVVRAEDGLALSTRNSYLSPDERRAALALVRAARAGREAAAAGGDAAVAAARILEDEDLVTIDYTAIWRDRMMVAGWVGRTSYLTENIAIREEAPRP